MSTAAYSPLVYAASSANTVRSTIGKQLRGMLLDTLMPLGIYAVTRRYLGFTEVQALLATGAQPLLAGLRTVAFGGRLSPANAVVFAGILVNLVALVLGGNARVLLLRESLMTAVFGMACLASLPSSCPLIFFLVRHFQVGNEGAGVAAFTQRLRSPFFLQSMRVMTAVWGFVLIADFAVRAWMVMRCSPATVLAVSPFLLNGTILATIAWSVRYGRQRQARSASPSTQQPEPEKGAREQR